MAHLGRRTTDLAQKMKGREALRFQLELIPFTLDGVPASAKNASFMWERGTKLQYTEPSPVNTETGVVYWGNTLLKQTATVYRDGEKFKPKEYYFKIQDIIGGSKKRQTFAKCKIDLAKYCSCQSNEVQEVTIPVSGAGKLQIRITATWLRHSSPENDAITEISEMSLGNKSATSSMYNDQDLSGFESSQSRLHRQRQKQGLPSPFVGGESSPNQSVGRSPQDSPARPRLNSGRTDSGLSVKATPDWRKRNQSRFHDVDLNTVHEEETTPRMGQPPRQAFGNEGGPTHVRQVSGQSFQSTEIYSGKPASSDIAHESYHDLISSDDEAEGGLIKATKRWWKSKDQSGSRQMDDRPASTVVGGLPSDLDFMNMEDVSALRQLARQALMERDAEQLRRQQVERHARHLQADCEALTMSKSMLVERLKEAEDRLLTTRQDEVMAILVRTKIKLAQSEYVNLELTGYVAREREKVMLLKQRMTDLEAAYHSTLDSLDRLQHPQPNSQAANRHRTTA